MSVKLKTLLISIISFIVISVVTFVIFHTVILKYINEIKIQHLNNNFEAVQKLLDREEDNISKTVLNWTQWNDSYNFTTGKNSQFFIKEELQNSMLKNLNLNFMFFIDAQGHIVHSITDKMENKTENFLINKIFNKSTSLKNNSQTYSGILNVDGRIFTVSILPVTTTDEKIKNNGSLIVGRYIDSSFFNYVYSVTKARINFKEISPSNEINTSKVKENDKYISLYKPIEDIYGNKSIVCSVSMEHGEYDIGESYFKIILLIFFIILTLIFVAYFIIINKYILNPLEILSEFMGSIANTKDIKARISLSGNNEIKNIGSAANKMLSELESAYYNIFYLSYSDKLTGLKNRAYIENEFHNLDKKKRDDYLIIMGDINGLKLINDTFGHKEGDRLIRTVGCILESVTSKDDIVARWGGDEFVILVIDKNRLYLSHIIRKIKDECEKIENFSFKVGIGLGSAQKSEGDSWETVLRLAEKRMYKNKITEVRSSRNRTYLSLVNTLYENHIETKEHTGRIKEFSHNLGEKMGLSKNELKELEILSLIHDIGKLGIPDHILMKSGKLTDEEWQMVKEHTEIGYRIAKATQEVSHIAKEILYHHENFNGTGYPEGLKGKDIPILSRIINVVSCFDTMVYERNYSIHVAIRELKKYSGTKFDPFVVSEFIDILEKYKGKNNKLII